MILRLKCDQPTCVGNATPRYSPAVAFPLGKPILFMLLASATAGTIAALRPESPKTDLVIWTFTDLNARTYRGDGSTTQPTLCQLYQQETGQSVSVKLIGGQALNVRLTSIFDNGGANAEVPDVVEVEISSVGRFFRPPLDKVGFLPLNDRLASSGWDRRLLASRLAPWSKQGVVFGVPRDVHPIAVVFRKDLFEEAGIDLSTARTWPEFQKLCLEFQKYWHARGFPNRRAIELPSTSVDYLVVMLLQRHINLLDSNNVSHMTDDRVAETIEFYARCVAGDQAFGGDASPGANLWVRDLVNGDLCSVLAPDWRTSYLRATAPDLNGKLQMMPVPRFDPSDAPTATWGGTMMAIPKNARDPEKSWKLLQYFSLSPQAMNARLQYSTILPPVIEAWDDPRWHRQDRMFGGQQIGEMYISLARELPERYVTPFTTIATQSLTVVLNSAITAVQSGDDKNLRSRIQGWLREADADLKKRIEFGKFDP